VGQLAREQGEKVSTSVIPALGRVRQEDCESEVSLGYIVILSQTHTHMHTHTQSKLTTKEKIMKKQAEH
jgi:hypothetical protein